MNALETLQDILHAVEKFEMGKGGINLVIRMTQTCNNLYNFITNTYFYNIFWKYLTF